MNVNTKRYWDDRFGTGNWENAGGRLQTRLFAQSQVAQFGIKPSFNGSILDFGCGLGDAIHVYHSHYPKAELSGVDISYEAIKLCQKKYGDLAYFKQGDHLSVSNTDIIIASNVLEHLSNHLDVARILMSKCRELYITVPYKENPLCDEHVNYYRETTFNSIGNYQWQVFPTKGWSQYGWRLYYHLYFKNVFRPFFGRKIVPRKKQIIFYFNNMKDMT